MGDKFTAILGHLAILLIFLLTGQFSATGFVGLSPIAVVGLAVGIWSAVGVREVSKFSIRVSLISWTALLLLFQGYFSEGITDKLLKSQTHPHASLSLVVHGLLGIYAALELAVFLACAGAGYGISKGVTKLLRRSAAASEGAE